MAGSLSALGGREAGVIDVTDSTRAARLLYMNSAAVGADLALGREAEPFARFGSAAIGLDTDLTRVAMDVVGRWSRPTARALAHATSEIHACE
jgi:hypothetical protein